MYSMPYIASEKLLNCHELGDLTVVKYSITAIVMQWLLCGAGKYYVMRPGSIWARLMKRWTLCPILYHKTWSLGVAWQSREAKWAVEKRMFYHWWQPLLSCLRQYFVASCCCYVFIEWHLQTFTRFSCQKWRKRLSMASSSPCMNWIENVGYLLEQKAKHTMLSTTSMTWQSLLSMNSMITQ